MFLKREGVMPFLYTGRQRTDLQELTGIEKATFLNGLEVPCLALFL